MKYIVKEQVEDQSLGRIEWEEIARGKAAGFNQDQDLFRVFFGYGSDEIVGQEDILDHAAMVILNHPNLIAEISGHSDSWGGKHDNVALSQKRALAVQEELVKRGVPIKRTVTCWFGSSRPRLIESLDQIDEAARRVEILLFRTE